MSAKYGLDKSSPYIKGKVLMNQIPTINPYSFSFELKKKLSSFTINNISTMSTKEELP